ncbi:alkaline phosphatase [Candidatus Acetothermia bacterium]|jgi:alkaline phosphatase|nr:alkaline phosphatase [Candidatus Acetothermia bacterium]MCI2432090.1 alkaline phosphatase [Candidatus Acetothermia bacterium]MCI2435897.1 alkaline phosphatase [Candidatus Acetothermia bacterium]
MGLLLHARRFVGLVGLLVLGALAVVIVVAAAIGSAPSAQLNVQQARNVILLIGDGMGDTHILATRYWDRGKDGRLAMDELDVIGEAATHPANDFVTDSAAAGTAIATGVRTNNGVIAFDPTGKPLTSILVEAQRAGKSTGLITEVTITHATPAPFAARAATRAAETEIAPQMLNVDPGMLVRDVDVLMGGGEANFLPRGVAGDHCAAAESARTDRRNLIAIAEARGYRHVSTAAELTAVRLTPTTPTKLLGLFACQAMAWDLNRPETEPTSAQKLEKALEILGSNQKGFFLMLERGRIDWAAEANDGLNTVGETRAFDHAVAKALEFARRDGRTLVVVTADHEAGGMSIVWPGDKDKRGLNLQTLPTADGGAINLAWATRPGHTAAPVTVRAFGPGAGSFAGIYHLTDLYSKMRNAAGLGN